jgi:photosystem II stability/assembly factor-like uncharacterized protein
MIFTGCETAGDRFKSFKVKENIITTIPGHYIRSICFLDKNKGFVAISKDSILKTTDGCKSFNVSLVEMGESFTKIRFINDSVGFVLGNSNKIYKTTNGGNLWEKIVLESPGKVLTDIVCLNNDKILVSAISTEDTISGYIFKSDNGGLQWKMTETIPVSHLIFSNDTIGFACGKEGMLKSMDGGSTWEEFSSQKANEIVFLNENEGYAAYQRTLYTTIDGGKSWKLLKSILTRHWIMGDDDSKIESLSIIDETTLLFTLNARLIKVSGDGKDWSEYEFSRPYFQYQLLGMSSGIVYGYENLILINF